MSDPTIDAAETLTGDLRDFLLTHVRSMETPWSKLSEKAQSERIDACSKAASDLVRRTVSIIAHKGFPHVVVTTGKFTVKDGIKLEVSASGTVDNITKLGEHGPFGAVLVLAEAAAFFGEREEAKADPEQPDIPFDDDAGEFSEEDDPSRFEPVAPASSEMPEIPAALRRTPKVPEPV